MVWNHCSYQRYLKQVQYDLTLSWSRSGFFIVNIEHISRNRSGVFVVGFEQVNTDREVLSN